MLSFKRFSNAYCQVIQIRHAKNNVQVDNSLSFFFKTHVPQCTAPVYKYFVKNMSLKFIQLVNSENFCFVAIFNSQSLISTLVIPQNQYTKLTTNNKFQHVKRFFKRIEKARQ